MKRYLILFMTCIVLYTSFSTYNVYADDTFKSNLKDYLNKKPSEDDIYDYSLIITTLRTDGLSDVAIAGILGNIKKEGGGKLFCIEGYYASKTTDGKMYTEFKVGNTYEFADKPLLYTNSKGLTMGGVGHGLVQWSFERAEALSDFTKKHKEFDRVTVKHWIKTYSTNFKKETCLIPAMPGQVAFMSKELSGGYKSVKDALGKAKDEKEAARIFHDGYEVSSDGTDGLAKRQEYATLALPMVKNCKSVTGSSKASNGQEKSQQVADSLVQDGIWGEDKFVKFNSLVEEQLEMPERKDLSEDELKGIVDWSSQIKSKDNNSFISILRIAVVLLGIILLVWTILVYLCFWLDRINNFIDIDFLPLVTFGRLRVSPEENECTFNPKNTLRNEVQTVNHRTILGICTIMIIVSLIIITGYLYRILNYLIRFISSKISFL